MSEFVEHDITISGPIVCPWTPVYGISGEPTIDRLEDAVFFFPEHFDGLVNLPSRQKIARLIDCKGRKPSHWAPLYPDPEGA